MTTLEDLVPGAVIEGLAPSAIEVVSVQFHGSAAATLAYREVSSGRVQEQLVYRSSESRLRVTSAARQWAFDGVARSSASFPRPDESAWPTSSTHSLRSIFRTWSRCHTKSRRSTKRCSPDKPLRYLLADDPGAGKTIMAGLLIRELMLRGDLKRCLVVCPANLASQWQDEMSEKFQIPFDIIGRGEIEASVTGNPFAERDLVIGRIDLLKRDEIVERLAAVEWDLIIVDEAHGAARSHPRLGAGGRPPACDAALRDAEPLGRAVLARTRVRAGGGDAATPAGRAARMGAAVGRPGTTRAARHTGRNGVQPSAGVPVSPPRHTTPPEADGVPENQRRGFHRYEWVARHQPQQVAVGQRQPCHLQAGEQGPLLTLVLADGDRELLGVLPDEKFVGCVRCDEG